MLEDLLAQLAEQDFTVHMRRVEIGNDAWKKGQWHVNAYKGKTISVPTKGFDPGTFVFFDAVADTPREATERLLEKIRNPPKAKPVAKPTVQLSLEDLLAEI